MAEENKVVFKCKKCGKPFIVRQGSRRRFCDDCLVERISHKGEKEGKDGKISPQPARAKKGENNGN